MSSQLVKSSKFLSLVLRHDPGKIGIQLDSQGWADVNDLILAMNQAGQKITKETLNEVVVTNSKQRFAFNIDGTKIRASQGHSLKTINLELAPVMPPKVLYHGTVEKFIAKIRVEGLKKMNRQHVHLSADVATAEIVAKRRGKPIILKIMAEEMHNDGAEFFLSENGVWLTSHVEPKYIGLSLSTK